jgi:aldehyde dehydrogenase (NAD+)
LINEEAVKKTHRYTKAGLEEGAKLLCGGKPARLPGHFYKPTVFTNVKPEMKIAQEEIFGPSLSIISINSLEEAIKVTNDISYGLSSAIYTNNVRQAMKAAMEIEAGLTYVNSSTIGSEVHLPFGGMKDTGNGTREAGIEGIHEFSETKTIYIDYSGKLQKAQIDVVD